MRTLTRRLAPHARATWLTFAGVSVVALALAVALVLLGGGGRVGVVATVCTGVVLFVVVAAFLDAILVPGNPDVRRRGHAAGWSGALGAGWSDGGGHGGGSGDGGGSCG